MFPKWESRGNNEAFASKLGLCSSYNNFTVWGYRPGDQGTVVCFLAGKGVFYKPLSLALRLPQALVHWVPGSLFWGWMAEVWSWQPTSSAEIKNEWSFTSIHPYTFMIPMGTTVPWLHWYIVHTVIPPPPPFWLCTVPYDGCRLF